jgi:hypothetical protein
MRYSKIAETSSDADKQRIDAQMKQAGAQTLAAKKAKGKAAPLPPLSLPFYPLPIPPKFERMKRAFDLLDIEHLPERRGHHRLCPVIPVREHVSIAARNDVQCTY